MQEFLRNLKVRYIDQKFLYYGEGVERYYAYKAPVRDHSTQVADRMHFITNTYVQEIKKHSHKSEKIAFISIGCGAGETDNQVMQALYDEGYTFTFVGVDSSTEMIKVAQRTMQDRSYSAEFWVEDIVSPTFARRVEEFIKPYDRVIYTVTNGTIGNMVQTEITDTLYNLMSKGHLIIFDCAIREADSKIGDLKLFNRYSDRLQDPKFVDFVLNPLDMLGMPREVGALVLENFVEESIGVLTFRYSFRFKEPYTVQFLKEYIHFIPPEKIKLLEIRVYHPSTMINFFHYHNFSLRSQTAQSSFSCFVFEKN